MDFEKQSYWRDRFAHETAFEWLVQSPDLMEVLDPVLVRHDLGPSSRVLQLGSGTSDLQNHLRRRGFGDVTNVDYEPLAVERGRDLEERDFGDVKMGYVVADVTQMPTPRRSGRFSTGTGTGLDGEFDLVIDKSTVDAVSCGGDEAFLRMAEGVRRCLAPGGVWISLSYSASRFETRELPFDVDVVHKFPAPRQSPNEPEMFHWCYLLRPKGPPTSRG